MSGSYVQHDGCDHIFFIGYPGIGKTTVVKNLGAMFGRGFADTDKMMEASCGKGVGQIFAEGGVERLRKSEEHVLRLLKQKKSLLVSCGGTLVLSQEACKAMHEMGTVVYLEGTLDSCFAQIRSLERRPEIATSEQAHALYKKLCPIYEATCDVRINVDNKTFDEVADECAATLWEMGLL